MKIINPVINSRIYLKTKRAGLSDASPGSTLVLRLRGSEGPAAFSTEEAGPVRLYGVGCICTAALSVSMARLRAAVVLLRNFPGKFEKGAALDIICCLFQRKGDGKFSPIVLFARSGDRAPVPFGYFPAKGKPQPVSFILVLGI